MGIDETYHAEYLDSLYQQWKSDPNLVEPSWQQFFNGFEIGMSGTGGVSAPAGGSEKQAHVEALVARYRDLGHLLACLDPLNECPTSHPLLDLSMFELANDDLNDEFHIHLGQTDHMKLVDIISALKETYCRSIGVEYTHIQDPDEREWLRLRMEPNRNRPELSDERKIRLFKKLSQAHQFEMTLNKKYPGQTRFSLEGAEALISTLDAMILRASDDGCSEFVFGMAHRGRLNVLSNILMKPYLEIFQEFANSYNPDSLVGAGDVKYHNGYLTDITLANGKEARLFLVNNPSHLESVDPVAEGVVRGLRDDLPADQRKNVMPILIHGDSAFAGQGVVTETLNLSQLEGYKTHGTIHIVINNQIGYTTLPEHARSTRYSTDVAKMLMVPIFHVHGENPEALVHVIELAVDYRNRFGKDVVVDLVCYRRHGHNEGDEPYFTQPDMYRRIKERPPVHQLYGEKLIESGISAAETIDQINDETAQCLIDQFEADQATERVLPEDRFYEKWDKLSGPYLGDPVKTAIPKKKLLALGKALNIMPGGFNTHSKLKRILDARLKAIETGKGIDWANGESLAFASIVNEGIPIRLSGQDSGRGTFSQRHAVVTDTESGSIYVPVTSVEKEAGLFQVFNSSLSEYAVLGFEYGYALMRPDALVLWEAQFGDFANNAQSIIDLYIAAGEAKWRRANGLVMLLPHGLEGLGPEHSSARLERFLQLCADDNMQICHPTTPAQYFHVLRRQVKASYRKPLIIMSPKSLLRHPQAVSNLTEFSSGGFQPVIDDTLDPKKVTRVLITAGKAYYELIQRRQELDVKNVAIIRIEQYYPLPEDELEAVFDRYESAKGWYWVQEEPKNMGAFDFLRPRLGHLAGRHIKYIGRNPSSSPATGFHNIYLKEREALLKEAIPG